MLRWPRTSPGTKPLAQNGAQYTYLLDEDDDLAAALNGDELVSARRMTTVRVLRASPGEHDLGAWFGAAGDGPGLLVLEGVLAFETHLAGRTATELIGAGDLLMAPQWRAEEMVDHGEIWRVLTPIGVGVLDQAFLEQVRLWPPLSEALMRRVSQRVCDINALRAIASHPRLEVRLVLLLWHLASRWGKVEPSGIRLQLPLTHRLLGQLVGAERPSITHALTRLGHLSLLGGSSCDLHLHGSMEVHLELLAERDELTRQERQSARAAGVP